MAGTALTSKLGFVAWEAEDSFADAADDTYTYRMQVRDEQIDVSNLTRELIPRGGVFQRMNEGDLDALGAFGSASTFSTTFDLYGHGSATTGALSATPLLNLLGHAIGTASAAQVGTTAAQNWSSVSDSGASGLTGGTFLDGGILRVGSLGDGYAGGQMAAIDTYTVGTNRVTLLTALAGIPQSGHVIYAPQLVYPKSAASGSILTSSGATSNNTLRFVLATSNLQFVCRGCACTGVTLEFGGPGSVPRVTLQWTCVSWNPVSQTFPSATAVSDKVAAPLANGSLFIQDSGTVTRVTDIERDFTVTIGQGMVPVMGSGGENSGQTVVGWRRVPAQTTMSFSVEAQAVTASPTWHGYFATAPTAQVYKHIMWTGSIVDGSAVGMYFPRCKPTGKLPTQSDMEGLNYIPLTFEALTSADTSTELELANWILALG